MKRVLMRLMGGPSCQEILDVLQAYLDGEVDAATAAKVAQHLDRCSGCTDEAATYEEIVEEIHQRARPIDPQVIASLEMFGMQLLEDQS